MGVVSPDVKGVDTVTSFLSLRFVLKTDFFLLEGEEGAEEAGVLSPFLMTMSVMKR